MTKIRTGQITNSSEVWTSWTPTWTNLSIGNGTLNYAKGIQIGKTFHFRVKLTLGSTSSVSGIITLSLPVTLNADYAATDIINCVVIFYDFSVTTPYQGIAVTPSTTTLALKNLHTDGTRGNNESTAASDPIPFGTSDIIYVSGTLEVA
jgi:hypothetical protein